VKRKNSAREELLNDPKSGLYDVTQGSVIYSTSDPEGLQKEKQRRERSDFDDFDDKLNSKK
jgi:hypothetical protein